MHKQIGKIYISTDMILVLEHFFHQILISVQYADGEDSDFIAWNMVSTSTKIMLVSAKTQIQK